jgi:Tol biopolymer transport system component
MSGDGRFIVFFSNASNLVPGDANGTYDVFVRDTISETTSIVSVGSTGNQGNAGSDFAAISDHGRYVAFASSASNLVPSDTNGETDVFVRDREAGTTTRVSESSAGAEALGACL